MSGDERIVVIGAGAAGLMAAGRLAERGKQVILLEKNDILGKKLLITGKGRCNITNACDISDFFKNIPRNSKFLYSALYGFTNIDLTDLLELHGLSTKVERGERVFPVSDKSADVVAALKKYALKSNVSIVKDAAERLIIEDGRFAGIKLQSGKTIPCAAAIVATGGKSYKLTGSTGDGYRLAKAAGHHIVPQTPSLVPLETKERWVADIMGLSLKNVGIKILDSSGKTVYSDFGEMLFTHFGVSGPVILSASAHMRDIGKQDYTLAIDLKPALSESQLDARLMREIEAHSRKFFSNVLDELLPKKLIPIIIRRSGIDPQKQVDQISKAERAQLISALKLLTLHVKGFRPIEEAIVTSGGVDVKEINPSTMESKLVGGLYFAGEVIDVDAYTGGFNLQIAFSTGYLAGDSI